MREGRPSFTAAAVAFARGVHRERDPIARSLVPAGFAVALAALDRSGAARPIAEGLLRVGSLGLVDHLQLRTAAIDAALQAGLEAGATQLVILGAGLDARAWRMEHLAGVRVFEVDHPATQAYKRERVAGLRERAGEIRFVPVDFEKQSLGDALGRGGHDATQRSFWIWEGVTMYLNREAMRGTLREVSARSPAGSRLAVTYTTPGASVRAASRTVFSVLGEPILGAMAPEEVAVEAGAAGFVVLSDTGPRQWADSHGGFSAVVGRLFGGERLAVCARS